MPPAFQNSHLVGVDAPLLHVLQLLHGDAAVLVVRCHGCAAAAAAVVRAGAWDPEQTQSHTGTTGTGPQNPPPLQLPRRRAR